MCIIMWKYSMSVIYIQNHCFFNVRNMAIYVQWRCTWCLLRENGAKLLKGQLDTFPSFCSFASTFPKEMLLIFASPSREVEKAIDLTIYQSLRQSKFGKWDINVPFNKVKALSYFLPIIFPYLLLNEFLN